MQQVVLSVITWMLCIFTLYTVVHSVHWSQSSVSVIQIPILNILNYTPFGATSLEYTDYESWPFNLGLLLVSALDFDLCLTSEVLAC